MPKVVCIIQARMGSERLQGKSMMDLCGQPLLSYVIQRAKRATTPDALVLATPETLENDVLENLARELKIEVFRGSEDDVLNRFIEAARMYRADVIIRIAADNPLTAPEEIDRIVAHHLKTGADYSFNAIPRMGNNYPDGLGAEVINFSTLEKIDQLAKESRYREHISTYIWEHEKDFHIETTLAPPEIAGPDIKLDIDTIDDLRKLESLIKALPANPDVSWSAIEIVQTYREHFKTKTFFLLEHEGQVNNCLTYFNEITGQKQVIALSPFAMYELDRQNVPYRIPEDYYDPQELYQLGIDNYQKVEGLCNVIDNYVQKACSPTAEAGIKPAFFSFYHLKILYDAATIRLFQLLKLINAENPDVIFIYESRKYPFGTSETAPHLLFDNRESIYAQLLTLHGWSVPVVKLPHIKQLEIDYSQGEIHQTVSDKLRKKAVRWLQSHPQLLGCIMITHRDGWLGLFKRLKYQISGKKHAPIMLLGGGENWANCQEELQSAGIGPSIKIHDNLECWCRQPFPERMNPEALLNVWEGLQGDSEFRSYFVRDDIDFLPVVEERLRFLAERLTAACLKAYKYTLELLKNKGIKAVVSSTYNTGTGRSVAQAAHNAGVPVINWQHGAYGCYINEPKVIYVDLVGPDINLVFGEGIVEQYADTAQRFGTRLIPVGSAALDALAEKTDSTRAEKYLRLSPEKKVALYVTTNFYQNHLHISPAPPFSDNYFWHTQQAILDVLARHKDYAIIVKTHPNPITRDTPLKQYAKDKELDNCRFIKDECSLNDLLPIAAVIVIDYPSTTLLQALTTSKPIFNYTEHLHINEQAQKLLERRTPCYRDLEELLNAIDSFLSGGSTNVDLKDKEFLRKYGTHEGASGARAAKILIKAIQNHDRHS